MYIDFILRSIVPGNSQTMLSETRDQSAGRMLDTAKLAIWQVATSARPRMSAGNDDPNISDADWLMVHPEMKPVVVLKGYESRSSVSRMLVEWAAELLRVGSARVLIVTNDLSYDMSLSEVLPDSALNVVSVADASPVEAFEYVYRITGKSFDQKCILPLGGRLIDLHAFAGYLNAGFTASQALKKLVTQARNVIAQRFLFPQTHDAEWTPEQVWILLRKLGANQSSHNWLSVPGQVSLPENVLSALENGGLITGCTTDGRLAALRASSPLYWWAIRQLVNDPVVSLMMDVRVLNNKLGKAEATAKALQAELSSLAKVGRRDVRARWDYLAESLQVQQDNISRWNKERSEISQRLFSLPINPTE